MEPTTMINLRVLSTAAVMALVLPMAVPTASFAQNPNGIKANNGAGVRAGGGGVPRMGGGAPGGGFRQSGGGGGGAVHIGGGGGPQISGGGVARMGGGGGGVYRGGYGGGYHRGGGGGGFIPGAVAGAVIGGAVASQGYYGGPAYAPGYYDDQSQYYDDSVAVAPEGGDDVAYCSQRFRSYDPRSGTYLGSDGYRHPCP
jgi:hypothetical protein